MREVWGILRAVLFGPEWCMINQGAEVRRERAKEKPSLASWFSGSQQSFVPTAPQPVKLPSPAAVQVPKPLPPPPPIAPPPTQSSIDVEQAADDQRQQALNRKGMSQTLVAGDTGGYLSPSTTGTKKSLLG